MFPHLPPGCRVFGVPARELAGGQTRPMALAVRFRRATSRMKAAVPATNRKKHGKNWQKSMDTHG